MNMIVGPFVVTKGYTPFCDSNYTEFCCVKVAVSREDSQQRVLA